MQSIYYNQQNDVTPLITAVKYQNIKDCQLMIANYKSDIDKQNIHGETAVKIAADLNNIQITELLLANGANPNISDNKGWTPLLNATQHNNPELVKLLLKYCAKETIDTQNGYDFNALNIAVSDGYYEIAEVLLKNGANPNMLYKNNWTLLLTATNKNNLELVKLLLKYGAKKTIDTKNDYDFNPLNLAIADEHYDIAETLLKNGANPNILYKNNWTLLLSATNKNNIELVKLLLKYGAGKTINENNNKLINALKIALSKEHHEIAKTLLENGANPNIKDNNGWTPLMSAIKNGDVKIVELLLHYNANIYCRNNLGKSSLDFAERLAKTEAATKENHEILKLVQKKHKELKANFNKAAQTPTMTINGTKNINAVTFARKS